MDYLITSDGGYYTAKANVIKDGGDDWILLESNNDDFPRYFSKVANPERGLEVLSTNKMPDEFIPFKYYWDGNNWQENPDWIDEPDEE
jgi:hypothetical protein